MSNATRQSPGSTPGAPESVHAPSTVGSVRSGSVQLKRHLRGLDYGAQDAVLAPAADGGSAGAVQAKHTGSMGPSLRQLDRIQAAFRDPGDHAVQRREAAAGSAGPTQAPPAAGVGAPTQAPPTQGAPAQAAPNVAADVDDEDLAENGAASGSGPDMSALFAAVPPAPDTIVDAKANALRLGPANAWIASLVWVSGMVTVGRILDPTRALATFAALQALSMRVRQGSVSLMNASSVTVDGRKQDPTMPSLAEIHQWTDAIMGLRLRSEQPAFAPIRRELDVATRAANDAGVALFQAQQVLKARATWRTNDEEVAPENAAAPKRAKNEVDAVFKASGHRRQYTEKKDGKAKIADWCGFTVAANLVRGAGMDPDHAESFSHTSNGVAFFTYNASHRTNRVHNAIWNEQKKVWMSVEDYHLERGSRRRWIAPDEMKELMAGGKEPPVQPGDVVFVGNKGRAHAHHYAMADASIGEDGNLTTIEGNATGMKAGKDGGAQRDGDGELKNGRYGKGKDGFAAKLNDMRSKGRKKEEGKLDAQAGGVDARDGSITTRAIGRPSIVDFEQHAYAARLPPAEHLGKSMDELKKIAAGKKKGKKISLAGRIGAQNRSPAPPTPPPPPPQAAEEEEEDDEGGDDDE